MSYINLYTTNGSSSGDNVSPQTALNNNYDTIDGQIFNGYQAFNNGSVPAYASPEIGQSVWPSYMPDAGGAPLYVSDGTTWHVSDQQETWGGWLPVPYTDSHLANGGSIRLSNFGRVELMIDAQWASASPPSNKGVWTTFHDPNTAPLKYAAAQYAPVASQDPFILQGAISSAQDNTGHGEQVRWALDVVNVSGTNYLRIRYCYTDLTTSSFGPSDVMLHVIYDGQGSYVGVLN